jgi:hypothetical protein
VTSNPPQGACQDMLPVFDAANTLRDLCRSPRPGPKLAVSRQLQPNN